LLTNITGIITRNVTAAFQTTVEALKKEGKFDEQAQRHILETVKANIFIEIKEESRSFIEEIIWRFRCLDQVTD